jgi:hypothetical protein
MSYAYLVERFGSREKVDHFASLLKKNRVALTGSALIQVKLGEVWWDSDLDIVVAAGRSPSLNNRLKLIQKLTVPPLNYIVLSDRSQFHNDYTRLRDHVHSIVTLRHAYDRGLPTIQLIFARTAHLDVQSFIRTFDMMHCQMYLDDVYRIGDFVYFSVSERGGCTDPLAIQFNRRALERQSMSDWGRCFKRVFKYRSRGMTLGRSEYLPALFMFCETAQYRPGKYYNDQAFDWVTEALFEHPFQGATLTYNGDGVYTMQDDQNANLKFNIFVAAAPLYDYVYPAEICYDMLGVDTPYETLEEDNRLVFENLLALKIVFGNMCTVYSSMEQFNAAIRFFRPCNKDAEVDEVAMNYHTGQPSLCQIPLGNGNIVVPAQQLYACLRNHGDLVMLTIVIDTNSFITYDLTRSENTILGLSSYMSARHCQDGSRMDVHLCRKALKSEYVHRAHNYYTLKSPTQDTENFGDEPTRATGPRALLESEQPVDAGVANAGSSGDFERLYEEYNIASPDLVRLDGDIVRQQGVRLARPEDTSQVLDGSVVPPP